MKRLIAALTTVSLSIGLLVAASPPASAAPRDIDNSSLESVKEAYLTWLSPTLDVPRDWTGDTSKCVPGAPAEQPAAAVGDFSPAAHTAMLDSINYFREMAGLHPVTENLIGSKLAQQATLIMFANRTLTHRPTPDLACYSEAGRLGAPSNLAQGTGGARAVSALIDDYGAGDNATVGHRRWLLNPPLSAVGIGSTDYYAATYVHREGGGATWDNPRPTGGTAWPSAGYVPWEVMPTSGRWSYSRPGETFGAATVTMKRNGSPFPVTVTARGGPYGDPALVWESGWIAEPANDVVDTYDIAISGLAGGSVSYQVKTFRAAVARFGSVTVEGDASTGGQLTATAHDPFPADAKADYSWYADGKWLADGATYDVTGADVDKQLTVKATAYGNIFSGTQWASSTISSTPITIKPSTFEPSGVGIDGRAEVGNNLWFVEGSWTPPGKSANLAFSLQWLRDGTPIPDQTRYYYQPTSADVGRYISLRVTGTAPGYVSATVTTASIGPIVARATPPAAFTKVPTPTLSGTPQVGRTLSAAAGAWSPKPSSLSYQWYRSGKAIAGATGPSYRLAPATMGGTITVRVTARRAGYVTTTSKPSKATSAVKPGAITALKPRISGTVRVGRTLVAVPGKWQPATTTFAYQWYRNKSKVKGATRVTYVLTSGDKGKKIRVKVTGRAAGYTAKAMTSSKTGKVGARG